MAQARAENVAYPVSANGIDADSQDTTGKVNKIVISIFTNDVRSWKRKEAYCVPSTGIDPTQPISYTFSFFHLVAKLWVILVNIEREQRGVDGRISIECLDTR